MSNINPNPFTTRPEIEGTFGVVTSTHWIATAVGMAMLEKGGNAFDAGVAAMLVGGVVEQDLYSLGGEALALVYIAAREAQLSKDRRRAAVSAAPAAKPAP